MSDTANDTTQYLFPFLSLNSDFINSSQKVVFPSLLH